MVDPHHLVSYHDYAFDDIEDDEGVSSQIMRRASTTRKEIAKETRNLVWADIKAPVSVNHTTTGQAKYIKSIRTLGFTMHKSFSPDPTNPRTGGSTATYGKITFNRDLERQKQHEDASFACMDDTTDPEQVKVLMTECWRLKTPSVIISVTGSAQEMNLDPGLELLFKQGIARAARATNAWIFTGGFDIGVMQLVASALADAKCGTPCIGVCPFHMVTDKERFFDPTRDANTTQHRRSVHYVKRRANSYQSAALDGSHTHFLLVDAGKDEKGELKRWGSEIKLRTLVEEKLCETFRVPQVLLVVQGGKGTFNTVKEQLQAGCPVVLIKESGGCAQTIAEMIEPLMGDKKELLSEPLKLKRALEELLDEDGEFCQPGGRLEELMHRHKETVRPHLMEIGLRLDLLNVFTISEVHKTPFDMAILKAIVSSFKKTEDKEHEAEKRSIRQKSMRPLLPKDALPHYSSRLETNPAYMGQRVKVEDDKVPWSVDWPRDYPYQPTDFTDKVVLKCAAAPGSDWADNGKWADPDELHGPAVQPRFATLLDEIKERTTFAIDGEPRKQKDLKFDHDGRPLNPVGRTGTRGRGLLGKWGANHAADPIVTRYDPRREGTLQMVAIRRKDTNEWAIPGGMVDAGESVSQTVMREFKEEAGNFNFEGNYAKAQRFEELYTALFAKGEVVYRGYVDDPRNTDNAWLETVAFHFHCDKELGEMLQLRAGDDAAQVTWLDIDVGTEPRYRDLYASHRDWVDRIKEKMTPHEVARTGMNKMYQRQRVEVPDYLVPWTRDWTGGSVYSPVEFTADEVKEQWENHQHKGWADPPKPKDVTGLKERMTFEGPIEFDKATGAPLNPRGRTGVAGRGLLGRWGPNHAADPIVTRHHPQTGKLQVVAVHREDTGQYAIPGGMSDAGAKWNKKMHDSFMAELTESDDVDGEMDGQAKQYFASQLEELFNGSEARVVYRGYVDDPRNTDNAWLETTAYHFHCGHELGAMLPLQPLPKDLQKVDGKEARRVFERKQVRAKGVFWLDVEEGDSLNEMYASHRDWVLTVRARLDRQKTHPGLLQLVVRWGRVDIAKSVLKDPELLQQRQPTQVQMAFQEALSRSIDPNFDVNLAELLMEEGAKAADVQLPLLFSLGGRDHFGLFGDIRRLEHQRTGSWSASSFPGLLRSMTGELARSVTAGSFNKGKRQNSLAARRKSRQSRLAALVTQGEDYRLAMSPWQKQHIRFMRRWVKGFEDYAPAQHAVHNVDLMFWAILAGALELATDVLWRRCRSPLRAALLAQSICQDIQKRGGKLKDSLRDTEMWFSASAVGVLDNLPDQETARKLLLSEVGDFATLGSRGKLKDSIIGLSIQLGNKAFVSHRYCQAILDEMWWGRSPRSGRVCLQQPFPGAWRVYAQVFLPFVRILPLVPNDLCVGYPWHTKEQQIGTKESMVTVKWTKAMSAIWHIPRVKRAVVNVSTFLFTVLFVFVFLDRLCGPLDGERAVCFWLLVFWNVSLTVQEILQASLHFREWYQSTYNLFDVAISLLLFTACGLRYALISPQPTIAEDLASHLNFLAGGRLRPILHSSGRSEADNFRAVWISPAHADADMVECVWSWELECLRTVLGVAAPCLMWRMTEFLTMNSEVGVLMVCTQRMLQRDLRPWALFVGVAVMIGSAFSLNLLAPSYQLEAGAGAFKPFGWMDWGPTEMDLSAGGPFFLSFWGLFGFYEPAELSSATGSTFIAPVFLWGYMMIIAVLFINLLIAMFNQTYTDVHDYADEEWKMSRVDKVNAFMRLYPVPPPLNLFFLTFDLSGRIVEKLCDFMQCCRRSAEVAPDLQKTESVPITRGLSSSRGDNLDAQPKMQAKKESKPRRLSFADDCQRPEDAISPLKNKEIEPRNRLQQELMRQATRMRLMRGDSTLNKQSKALFTQREQERAEDAARHAYLQFVESNRIATATMGRKDDQILSIAKRAFQQGVDTHDAVKKLRESVEKIELKALEDRQDRQNNQRETMKKVRNIDQALSRHPSRGLFAPLESPRGQPTSELLPTTASQPAGAPPKEHPTAEATSNQSRAVQFKHSERSEEKIEALSKRVDELHEMMKILVDDSSSRRKYLSKAANKQQPSLPPLPQGTKPVVVPQEPYREAPTLPAGRPPVAPKVPALEPHLTVSGIYARRSEPQAQPPASPGAAPPGPAPG